MTTTIKTFDEIPNLVIYLNGGEPEHIVYDSGIVVAELVSTAGGVERRFAPAVVSGGVTHDPSDPAKKVGQMPAIWSDASAGTNEFRYTFTQADDIRTNPQTVFFLAQLDNEADFPYVIDGSFGTGNRWVACQGRSDNEYFYVANTALNTGAGQVSGAPMIRGITWDRDSLSDTFGRAYVYHETDIVVQRTDRVQTNSTAWISLLQDSINGNPAINGGIGIYAMYDRVLTDVEIQNVVELMAYWRDNGEAPPLGLPLEKSHTFGPIRPSDATAAVTWHCSRTAYEADGVFVSASNLSNATERKTGDEYFLDVTTAQPYDAGKIQGRATTSYSTINTKTDTLIVEPPEGTEPPEPPPENQIIVIDTQPQNQTVLRGGSVRFDVTAHHTGGEALFYYWPKDGRLSFYRDNLSNWGDVPYLEQPMTHQIDEDEYTAYCRIRWGNPDNTDGEVYTVPATVTFTYQAPTMVQDLPATLDIAEGASAEIECKGSYPEAWGRVYYVWEASRDDGATWHEASTILSSVNVESTRAAKLIINSATSTPRDPTLIYPEHLAHEGTWDMIGGDYKSMTQTAYGGFCMALHPDKDKIYFGHRVAPGINYRYVSLVDVPVDDFNTTIEITMDGVELVGDMGAQWNHQNNAAGFCWNNRYIFTRFDYYDNVLNGPSHNYCDLDLTNFGPGLVKSNYEDFGLTQQFTSMLMLEVPDERKAEAGWPCLMGGMASSIYGSNVVGISLCGFDPDDVGTMPEGEPFPTEPFAYHKASTNELVSTRVPWMDTNTGVADVRHPPNTVMTRSTELCHGAVWPSGTNSILFFGRKGLGEFEYKVKSLEYGHPGGGDGAGPYRSQVWAYDARDILASRDIGKAAGGQPGDYPMVYPYATWEMPVGQDTKDWQGVHFKRHGNMGALAYDEDRRRIYWSHMNENAPAELHAMQVAAPVSVPHNDHGVKLRCHIRMYDPMTSSYRGHDTGITTSECTINVTGS